MTSRSLIAMRYGFIGRLTALMLLITTLPGCLATAWNENLINGEPKGTGHFVLSTSIHGYELTRWWGTNYGGKETVTVPRNHLPAGCKTARFFLNDSAHELKIAQLASANWVTGDRPPLPDGSYPPCAILVSYGSFTELPSLEGMAVTTATGLLATSERRQPHPAAWSLVPVTIVADIYIFLVALVTIPIWAPIGLMMENSNAKRDREAKAEKKRELPPPVTACWTAIDNVMGKNLPTNPDYSFVAFTWPSGLKNAYTVTTADEVFSPNKPVPIDTRVTLRQGQVQFRIENKESLWTDADAECGLRAGDVVITNVNIHK